MLQKFLSNKFNISVLLVLVNFILGICIFQYLSGSEILIVILLLLINNWITFTMGVAKGLVLNNVYLEFMKGTFKKNRKKKNDTK